METLSESLKTKTSCGIIVYTIENDKYYFFVGHPGGQSRDYWALFKGLCENHEDHIETAIREFGEETGLKNLINKEQLVPLGYVKQSRNKNVYAYAFKIENRNLINLKSCHSNMADNCPWPEIDKYDWKEYKEIIQKTHPTHKIFYDKILEL